MRRSFYIFCILCSKYDKFLFCTLAPRSAAIVSLTAPECWSLEKNAQFNVLGKSALSAISLVSNCRVHFYVLTFLKQLAECNFRHRVCSLVEGHSYSTFQSILLSSSYRGLWRIRCRLSSMPSFKEKSALLNWALIDANEWEVLATMQGWWSNMWHEYVAADVLWLNLSYFHDI